MPNRTRRPLAGLLVAAAAAIGAVALFGQAAPATASTGPDCGPTVYEANGTPWVCTFDDEFDGTSLDRGKWTVQTTAGSGFTGGTECFVDSTRNVRVAKGTLRLTVRDGSVPFTCTSPTGDFTTRYTSGSVNGYRTFAQRNGRFEVRAKLPAATVQGLQETLWLWPENMVKYGKWPLSGEIDFGEFYSSTPGWNIPYLHYAVDRSSVDWSTNTNVFTALPGKNAQPGMNCRIDQSAYNVYTVVWRPGRIVLQVNHRNCVIDNYAATNAPAPAPFDQPFFVALTQGLGVADNAFLPGTTLLPATTRVAYVRVWK